MGYQITTLLTVIIVLAFLAHAYYRWQSDFLRKLRGPDSPSFLYGNELDIRHQKEVGDCEFKWAQEYGNVWRHHGCLGKDRLVVADPTALRYILHVHGNHFSKPKDVQKSVEMTFGRGLVWAPSGEIHQRQREIMNPAFSAPQIRAFLSVFQNSASKLAQIWKEEVVAADQPVVNVMEWLSRTALDNIGEAGFGFQFGSLDGLDNPLREQNEKLFSVPVSRYDVILRTLWYYVPEVLMDLAQYLPAPRFRRFRKYSAFIRNFSRGIIEKSIMEGDGKDVMSVLLRANASEDPRAKLSDIEMVDQIATLLFAAHDTTTNSLAWYLYEIARNPQCQERARAEIAAIRAKKGGEILSATDLDSMTYTLATLKESLRLHPIVHTMAREATQDDVIPLGSPIVAKSDEQVSSIHVRKGTPVDVAIGVYNRLPDIWGADANEFNPERFLNIDKSKRSNIGVFANLLTFSGGTRGCIGWRFAVLQMQIIIVALVENFQISLPPQTEKTRIYRKPIGMMIPTVEGRRGAWMGLVVKSLEE
ncbi:cytochrome P450 [Lactarius quietus]|nr:cytochrome P450 [Lactarius quietus]